MELKLMRHITEKLEANEEVALITVINLESETSCSNGAMMVVGENGEALGKSLGGKLLDEEIAKEAVTCLNRGLNRKITVTANESSAEVFIGVLSNRQRLIIAGAGNIAHYVYRYARILGYQVTVLDNRAEMLNRQRFPEANELILGDMAANIAAYNINSNMSIVIASHNHEFDEAILQEAVTSPARYIGMLSNRRKAAEVFNRLRERGISEELMSRVHSPIGLDLGGGKTAEIALAIMAEIQANKYGRTFSVGYSLNKTD